MSDYSKKVNTVPGNVYNLLNMTEFALLLDYYGDTLYSNNGESQVYLEEFKNVILNIKNSSNNKIKNCVLSVIEPPEYLQEKSFVEIGIDNMFNKNNDNYLEIFSYNIIPESPFEILKCKYLNIDHHNGMDIDKFYDNLSLFSPKRIIRINGSYEFIIKKFTDKIGKYGDRIFICSKHLSMRKLVVKDNYHTMEGIEYEKFME